MPRKEYAYPSDLDSDGGYESDQYSDWSDDDDADSFAGVRGWAPPPRYSSTGSLPSYTGTPMCIVCQRRPPYYNPKTRQSYPTCGLTCAALLGQQGASTPSSRSSSSSRPGTPRRSNKYSDRDARRIALQLAPGVQNMAGYQVPRPATPPVQPRMVLCVVCKAGWSHHGYATCGLTCAEKLCKDGGDPTMCNYCHQKPKHQGHEQCGTTCADKAKVACLLCKSRPKNGAKYHLCGKMCKRVAMKSTPMILEAPKGHKTYEMAEQKFQKAWHNSAGPLPPIKKIYKIIENDAFLKPYAAYKQKVGNEHFRYHGTKRQCQLGVTTTQLCASTTCPVCSILKSSFKVSVANAGTFGRGVYSSSASNMAFAFCGGAAGSMLVTKVVLGKSQTVTAALQSCPSGFDSVVFDKDGPHNETIVYTDDAIRPVFLIMF